jgi:hypothetical protein
VAGVKHMDLGLRNVAAIGLRLRDVERRVIFAPEDKKSLLTLAQPRLPAGVGFDIGAIIVEEVGLNVRLPGLAKKRELVGS